MNSKLIALGSIVSVVLWEHFGNIYGTKYIPSKGLTFLTEKSIELFKVIGGYFGELSALIRHLKLVDLFKNMWNLIVQFSHLTFSPFSIMYGYAEVVKKYAYEHYQPMVVHFGSLLILLAVGVAAYRSRGQIAERLSPVWNFIQGIPHETLISIAGTFIGLLVIHLVN